MDNSTYEQVELTAKQIEDTLPYLKDNMNVKVLSFKAKVFGVEPPTFVELEVTYTEPGVKGSTATGTTKPATVETGAKFNVPLFVEIGDRIRVDTRTGQYMERAN
ncbi:Elongation factor P [compost metagenome]